MDAQTKAEVDAAIAKATTDLKAELAAGDTALSKWITANPITASRVFGVAGAIGGGSVVYVTLKLLGH